MIKRFSEIGAKSTGYPCISIFHDFKYHPKDSISGTQEWLYEHLGALFGGHAARRGQQLIGAL